MGGIRNGTLRRLLKQPGFVLLAVLTLAVGMGPTTAVYAVFRQVLLRQLPVPDAGQLVVLRERSGYETGSLDFNGGGMSAADRYFSYPAYEALRGADPSLAAVTMAPTTLVTKTQAERVGADLVTGNYFATMRLRPVLGRLITEADDRSHAGRPVAVLSEVYWKSAFGADPRVLNSVVDLNGNPFVIVGVVAHSGIMDAEPAQFFVPMAMHMQLSIAAPDTLEDPLYRFVAIVGRDGAGEGRSALGALLNTVWVNWRREVLHSRAGSIPNKQGWMQTHLFVEDGSRGISLLAEDLGPAVMALQAMTALVLLVACANLANLLLARSARRRGELAVRLALGAGRGELVTTAVAEALLLGAGGAALGLGLALGMMRLLAHAVSAESEIGGVLRAHWDGRVYLFALAAAAGTSLVFSAAPALAATRVRPAEVLRHGQGATGGAGARFQRGLVAGSIALSLLLLLASVLLGWNLYRQTTLPLGYRTEHVLTFSLDDSSTGADPQRVQQVYAAIAAGLGAQPGVVRVAYAEDGLLTGGSSFSNVTVEGRRSLDTDPSVQRNSVTGGFLPLLGIPIVRGRDFSEADATDGEQMAIVNTPFVQQFFHGDMNAALGGHFTFGGYSSTTRFPYRIVGIVPAIYAQSPSAPVAPPTVYRLYRQAYSAAMLADQTRRPVLTATFYAKTQGDPAQLAGGVRALVRRVDPRLPVDSLVTMREQLSDDVADIRLMTWLALGLGGLAVLLASVGLYGVLAYQIATRTREIGVRMALGASRGSVARLVLASVLRLTLVGVIAGAAGAWGLSQLLHTQVAGLARAPVALYAGAGLLLFAAGLVAAIVPAQRAARVEPMEALRVE